MNGYDINDDSAYYYYFSIEKILGALSRIQGFKTAYAIKGSVVISPNVENVLHIVSLIFNRINFIYLLCSYTNNIIHFSGTLSNTELFFDKLKAAIREYCTEEEHKVFYVMQYNNPTTTDAIQLMSNIPKIYNNYNGCIHAEIEDFIRCEVNLNE